MTTSAPPSLAARIYGMRREVAKFGVIGLSGTAVNFAVFNFCVQVLDMYSVRSSVLATAVAICTNYLGYRFWVYRDRERGARTREMSLFLVFSLIGLVIENGLLYLTHYTLGWDSSLQDNGFKFLGMGVATLFRFASYRTWVFRKLVPDAAEPDAEQAAFTTGSPR
jgi:putative flippase GtrA